MANQNQIEQCIAALTQLVTQNNQPQNWRHRIEKEIRYLQTFHGEPGTLPSFIDSVTRTLADHQNEADRVFQVIYNTKILGKAKNLLNVNPPADWTTCKQRLKKHYRASKDQMTITKEIGNLRVSSIKDLDNKLRELVEDVTEYAAFEDNGEPMIEIFGGMLVQKVKELVSGSLSYAIMNKQSITEIREIVNSFIGQDQSNLNMNLIIRNFNKNSESKYSEKKLNSHYNHRSYQNRNSNNFQFNRNRNQYRSDYWQPRANYSNYSQNNSTQQFRTRQNDNGQSDSRQNRQRPQPMEVDTLSRNEDVDGYSKL